MKTSNFWISGSSPSAVSIARRHPRGWQGCEYKKLAPSWKLINLAKVGKIDEYVCQYNALLDSLNAKEVFEELGSDSILLCWEKPGDFCHRRLVAEWFEQELGIEVPEI